MESNQLHIARKYQAILDGKEDVQTFFSPEVKVISANSYILWEHAMEFFRETIIKVSEISGIDAEKLNYVRSSTYSCENSFYVGVALPKLVLASIFQKRHNSTFTIEFCIHGCFIPLDGFLQDKKIQTMAMICKKLKFGFDIACLDLNDDGKYVPICLKFDGKCVEKRYIKKYHEKVVFRFTGCESFFPLISRIFNVLDLSQ